MIGACEGARARGGGRQGERQIELWFHASTAMPTHKYTYIRLHVLHAS